MQRRPQPRGGFSWPLLLAAVAAALPAGCNDGAQPYVSYERLDRGLVIVLPGIEGRSPFNELICEGLNAGGVNWAIELQDWTSMWGPLYSLRAQTRNRWKATEIADRVVRYQESYRGRPVVLVGQSGGGAMAVWIAEAMPPGRKLDGLILLDAALSNTYLLSRALDNSRRGVVNFFSSRDWLLFGTTLTGSMDGEHGATAGHEGFVVPSMGGRPPAYGKFFQIPWHPRMAQTGHVGIHMTSGAARFVAAYVAPLVLADEWNAELISRIWSIGLPGQAPPAAASSPIYTPDSLPGAGGPESKPAVPARPEEPKSKPAPPSGANHPIYTPDFLPEPNETKLGKTTPKPAERAAPQGRSPAADPRPRFR